MSLYYNSLLLNKKGRFRKIWIAAHTPSKLHRLDIIQIDLPKMCDEIKAFITNTKNLPKFSLLISSHLMLGLTRVLQKKNVYLYDDLKAFSLEIKRTFYAPTIEKPIRQKKGDKSIASKSRVSIKLNENLPDIFDTTALLNFNLEHELDEIVGNVEIGRLNLPAYNITMDEGDFGAAYQYMPDVSYDYVTDMFGVAAAPAPTQQPPPRLSEAQPQPRMSVLLTESALDMPQLEITAAPTTSSAAKEAKTARRPFQEIQNIPNMSTIGAATEERTAEPARRFELSKGPQANEEIHAMQDRFAKDIQDTTGVGAVATAAVDLFGDTVVMAPGLGDDFNTFIMPEVPMDGETIADQQRIAGLATTIAEEGEEMPTEPLPPPRPATVATVTKTLSDEINKMTELQVKKYARAHTKAGGKRALIDYNMTISDNEMRNRMIVDETRVDPFQVYRNAIHRNLLIEPVNLMKIPSCRLSRDLRRDFTQPSLNKRDLFSRLASRNMLTKREVDHNDVFYLTETNKLRAKKRVLLDEEEEEEAEPVKRTTRKKQPVQETTTTPSVIDAAAALVADVSMRTEEKQRLQRGSIAGGKETTDTLSVYDKTGQPSTSKKRESTLTRPREEEEAQANAQQQQPYVTFDMDAAGMQFQPPQVDANEFNVPPIMNDTTINAADQTSALMNPDRTAAMVTSDAVEASILEKENTYELIVMEYLEAKKLTDIEIQVFFKDIVYDAQLTNKCRRAAKPRRLFATYLFSSMMNLAAKLKIQIEQETPNGPIELNLI